MVTLLRSLRERHGFQQTSTPYSPRRSFVNSIERSYHLLSHDGSIEEVVSIADLSKCGYFTFKHASEVCLHTLDQGDFRNVY
jgi:hypothetical protein